MLLRSEDIDLTTPESEFATCDFLIDLKRNVIYHAARFAAYLITVFNQIFCTECLDRE